MYQNLRESLSEVDLLPSGTMEILETPSTLSFGEFKASGSNQQRALNGYGVLYNIETKEMLEGRFTMNKLNGEGRLLKSSMHYYQGQFSDSQFHGKGKYFFSTQSWQEGTFVKSKLEGQGKCLSTKQQGPNALLKGISLTDHF